MSTPLDQVRSSLRSWSQHHVLALLDEHPALQQQLLRFESWYPGGISSYLGTATQLYRAQQGQTISMDAASVDDPFASWVPTVPRDDYGLLTLESLIIQELEAVGLQHAAHCAFVIVAGGLGERLGYKGIKLALPVETVTNRSYLEVYIQHIQALQRQLPGKDVVIPLAIMTSDATHNATHEFLIHHNYFGMPQSQITLLKQDTVPCLDAVETDQNTHGSSLRLVVDSDQNGLVMKPHGHGDVHTLLHTSGLARLWFEAHNKRYIHFIQDTNALILNSTLPLLGATVLNRWQWAFTVVPRKAKDASGAIVKFSHPHNTEQSSLFNVEYHELDHFLRSKAGDTFLGGDINDPETGFSLFPGNINHFVVELEPYVRVLEVSQGRTPEIFNPKYRADQKHLFKSPARLESMMQDFPKILTALTDQTSVGFLSFPPSLVYSPCKNDSASAACKVAGDIPPQCACSAEHDFYLINKAKMERIGVRIEESRIGAGIAGSRAGWLGIPVEIGAAGPHIVFTPGFSIALSSLRSRLPTPSQIWITSRSTLIIRGDGAHNVTISALRLDGALRITACEGAVVEIKELDVSNAGFEYASVDENAEPVDAMRGYVLKANEVFDLDFKSPGHYIVRNDAIAEEN